MAPAVLNHHLSGATTFSTNFITRRATTRRTANFSVRMSLNESAPSLAVVGVTGAVGKEFLSVLSDRDFPYKSIKMLASKRSAGKKITFEDKDYVIEELSEDSFDGVDIALFSAGGSISKKFGPVAVNRGSVVIDNSSAFRMDENVPLVIPEVNPDAMSHIRLGSGKGALIANPNCSTIICLMAATPLHRHSEVVRMVVSTYQAASGAGAAAMEELELQTREVLEGKPPTCNIFNQQYAFNLFSHNAPVLSNGYNEEEMKLVKETRKIWNDHNVKVAATCIRVPVMRAHAESVNLQFENPVHEVLNSENCRCCGMEGISHKPEKGKGKQVVIKSYMKRWSALTVKMPRSTLLRTYKVPMVKRISLNLELPDTARAILSKAPGIVVIDDRASNHFPTPLEVSNEDDVAVGRIRQDLSQDENHGLDIFVCGDQIRKGAALNAIQIAELLL